MKNPSHLILQIVETLLLMSLFAMSAWIFRKLNTDSVDLLRVLPKPGG